MAEIEIVEGTEDDIDVPEEETEPKDEPFVYDDDSPNLVPDFMAHPIGKEELRKIADTVKTNFDAGWSGAEEYRRRFANDWKLFAGELPNKEWPWKNAANVHIPLMLEHISRLTARASSELFGDWQNVFGVVPLGPADDDVAEVLNKHGNWQIREQIPDFRRQMGDRMMLAFFWIGDVTVHSYYDPERKQNRHEVLTPDEFVTPFTFTSTMPDYSDVPWRCKICNYYRHQLEALKGDWFDVDKVLDGKSPSYDDTPDQEIARTVSQTQGQEEPEESTSSQAQVAPYKILWYEGWMRLPNQEEDRLVQVIMHDASRTLLKITIHEEPDWQDAERYRRQEAELQGFREQQLMHSQQLSQLEETQQLIIQSGAQDLAGPELVDAGLQQIQQSIPPLPVAPHWLEDPDNPLAGPEPARRVPVHMFTHIVCIEPFVGGLGLSYGRMQADFNRATNVLTSQFIDSATLGNVNSYLVTDTVDFGSVEPIGPGDVRRVKGLVGDELAKNIMKVPTQPANPQMMEMVDRIYGYARTSMQAPEILSGEPGKSGETYRGVSARIEQATKQLSVYTRKAADGLEQVLKNNAKLNARFLPDEEIVNIASHAMGQRTPIRVTRAMYERDYKAVIRADLRFATQQQRIQEANELLQFNQMVPQNQMNLAFAWQAAKKALVARGMEDMVPLLGPPPPPPTTPFGMPDPAAAAQQQQGAGAPPPGAPMQ